jgi:type IV pilus assembly protein PilF
MNAVRSTVGSMVLLISLCVLQGCASTSGVARAGSGEDVARANLNLGVAYLRQGRPDLAVENLQRALREDSRLADAHSSIALAYDQLGNPDDAERHYRRATQLEPANAAAANSYAVFLCRHDRWRDAEPYFRRAADNPRYSTPAAALTNAGVCAMNAGEADRAEEYFRAALARDSRFADALSSLMELSYQQGNYLQARAFMQRYTDVREANAQVLWLCFNIEQELEDWDAAERCAGRLRQQFPESAELSQLRQFERDARR